MSDFRITREDMRRFAPRADRYYVDAVMGGMGDIVAAGVDTPLRWSHFIAQWAHETGGFTIVREHCTWSAQRMCVLWPHRFKMDDKAFRARYLLARGDEEALAELAYGHRARPDLGNTEEGDGYNYRGGSFCQGTGRAWYREAGEAIGVDLEGSPDLIENPTVGLKATLWMWGVKKLNTYADQNNARAVGNGINRGNPLSSKEPIGLKDRVEWFDKAWSIWGAGRSIETTTDLDLGSYGTEVQAVQLRLRELLYQVGSPDKAFGPETGRAIAAFKADWAREHGTPLEPGTRVGPLTRAALAEADPIERPERAETTEKDLLEAGSTEMKAGQSMQHVGLLTAAAGGVAGAEKVGFFDWAGQMTSGLPLMQSTMSPVLETVRWGREHLLWVVLLLFGLAVYHRGWLVKQARLAAHRLGMNLGR